MTLGRLLLAYLILFLFVLLELLILKYVVYPAHNWLHAHWIYKQFRVAVMRLIKQYLLYCLRWQMSTPTLWVVILWLGPGILGTIVANFIGALIFFWVDRVIFGVRQFQEWEIKRLGVCHDCGHIGPVKRLRFDPRGYDRREDPDPQFRCDKCSKIKLRLLNLINS
jgi:hypothetical protein